jgi:alkaline phosphatase D
MILRLVVIAALSIASCATMPRAEAPLEERLSAAQSAMLTDFPQAPVSPALPTRALSKILVATCMNEEWSRDQEILALMTAQKADLAILAGDNVYGSMTSNDPLLSDLRAAYWAQSERREFKGLVSSTPTLAIWDDHDFGKNDAGADNQARMLAQAMFDRFWRVGKGHPQAHPNGVYGSWMIGPVGQRTQIIMLDTRFWRDALVPTDERGAPGKERYIPDPDPAKTILGAAQWSWLEGELKKPAELRLVVSSIQVVADGHGWEKWGNFPAEQKRLFDLIRATNAKGVVFISGDRHISGIYREPAETVGYPLYDFTASSVNMPWGAGGSEQPGTRRLGDAYYLENYGMVEIDWAARAIKLSIRDKQDVEVRARRISFEEIGVR